MTKMLVGLQLPFETTSKQYTVETVVRTVSPNYGKSLNGNNLNCAVRCSVCKSCQIVVQSVDQDFYKGSKILNKLTNGLAHTESKMTNMPSFNSRSVLIAGVSSLFVIGYTLPFASERPDSYDVSPQQRELK